MLLSIRKACRTDFQQYKTGRRSSFWSWWKEDKWSADGDLSAPEARFKRRAKVVSNQTELSDWSATLARQLLHTSHLGRVEPNWIELDGSATLARQLLQMSCYVWSCHPTLAFCGRKSSLVSGTLDENVADNYRVQYESVKIDWSSKFETTSRHSRVASQSLSCYTILAQRGFKRRASVVLSSNLTY